MSDAVVPHQAEPSAPGARLAPAAGWFKRAIESDMFYSFRRSRLTMVATAVTLLFFLAAIFAPLLAPYPGDVADFHTANRLHAPDAVAVAGFIEPELLAYSRATSRMVSAEIPQIGAISAGL